MWVIPSKLSKGHLHAAELWELRQWGVGVTMETALFLKLLLKMASAEIYQSRLMLEGKLDESLDIGMSLKCLPQTIY